ncbi:MAG: FlgD immunoglobulin-like domain containing protein [bacterium]|jgi:hypothetical protein|nr:hypothetical protein [candidate division KSB1 bacterium]MDH7561229.1 FlgD immunoglobulin-like domain containing protein [bacterium]
MRSKTLFAVALALVASPAGAAPHAGGEQTGESPVLVATSSSPLATAFNNGRRMVRDSRDNRYLVYQDVSDGLPIVCFVRSSDGKVWSTPVTPAFGCFPSLAIDEHDHLFLVWQDLWQDPSSTGIYCSRSTDGGDTWESPCRLNPIPSSNDDEPVVQYPVVEAGARYVYFAWQQGATAPAGTWHVIFFAALPKDLLRPWGSYLWRISQLTVDARFPALACNLGFLDDGSVHVVWAESTATGAERICYRHMDERTHLWTPPLDSLALDLSSGTSASTHRHPAISVGNGEIAHVVWDHGSGGGFHSLLFADIAQARFDHEVPTWGDAMVCVDDVYLKYSALVWVSQDEVYYMQARDGALLHPDPVPVSERDGVPSRYPSVCYKQFRADSLDVVWTDGSEPPYRILYRRMAKIYPGQSADQPATSGPRRFALLSSHPNPFRAGTVVRYELPAPCGVRLEVLNVLGQRVRTLVDRPETTGAYQVGWDGRDEQGSNLPGGVYLCRLVAGSWATTTKLVLLR